MMGTVGLAVAEPAMKQIPVVDLSAARTGSLRARQSLARQIDKICREMGFFTIAGHGVPAKVMEALREKAHAFFALPLHEKCKAVHPVAGTPRGYRALGGEALAHANDRITPPDLKEFYHIAEQAGLTNPTIREGRGSVILFRTSGRARLPVSPRQPRLIMPRWRKSSI